MPDETGSLKAVAARAIRLLDLTSLNDNDTDTTVAALCKRATLAPQPVAAVCIWPRFIALAGSILEDSGVRIAAVANFPAGGDDIAVAARETEGIVRSEEHTSELQSLMRISYAVFCLKKKNSRTQQQRVITQTRTLDSQH